MWNASYVQKQSNSTWQEWVRDKTREVIKKFPFPKSLLDARTKLNRYLLDRLRKLCQTRNWKQVVWKRHGGSWVSHVPLQKIDMKNEAGTSMSVFIDITGNWWVSLLVPVSSVPPAPLPLRIRKSKFRSFTSLQMVHTHALLPQGLFGRRTNLVKQSSDMVDWSRIEYQNARDKMNYRKLSTSKNQKPRARMARI